MMKHEHAGFSLVEFAIASLVTLTVLTAAFSVVNMVFTANDAMTEIMATQQNVRVAMNTIARDITMAGTGLPSGTVVLPNGTDSAAIIRPGMAAFSSPDRDIEAPGNVIPIVSPGDEDGPTIGGVDTDALTIFSIDQESPQWTVDNIDILTDRYEITFTADVSTGAMQLFPGDLLLFNNANGSVLACVSDIDSETVELAHFRNTDAMAINQPEAQFGNIASLALTGTSPPEFPPTTATRVNIINYFISAANADHPRLMRAVNSQAAQAIAEDIENLQFMFDLFDFETSASTSSQATTATPNQIRAVHIAINGRSPKLLRHDSEFYRFSLVSKINVRNSTFRNRYTGS
jgi:hypothetical protein